MADGYSWSATRGGRASRLPGPDRLGWWAAIAMAGSLLLHVLVFFALDRMKIAFHFEQAREISTRSIDLRPVEVRPAEPERALPPETVVVPPTQTSALLEEIDLLDKLPEDQDIDIKPEVIDPQYALQIQNPAATGVPEATAPEAASGFEIDTELPALGREPESIRPAEIGQLTVDPGALATDDSEIGKFADDLIKQGANGKVDKGTLDGMATLDNLLNLPPNILVGKKTMLPSDLLFEFNSSVLRESAKLGLMKLGLLMDKNPGLYCWIEGHTDLVGGDEFNLNLSVRRAEAVKSYLVSSMHMDADKIVTRGFGRYEPLVTSGSADEQAANRRVEIKMRKNPPSQDQLKIAPQRADVVVEGPSPKAILIKPQRLPDAEEIAPPARRVPEPAPQAPPPPKAAPVEQAPRPAPPLKATPVQEPAPKPPLKAQPVVEDLPALPDLPEIPKAAPVTPGYIPRGQIVEDDE